MNMMKRTLIGALVVALALIGTGCDSSSSSDLEAPVVKAKAIDDGGTLQLSWEAVDGAASYEIKAGDMTYTTDATTYDVTAPVATIEVRSVKGDSKSENAATIDCRVVETPTLDVYGLTDPDTSHHGGLGFEDDGTIVTYSLFDYSQFAALDYYADDGNFSPMAFVNPGFKKWNAKGNKAAAASAATYDEIMMADPAAAYSDSSLTLADGGLYYLWLDRGNDGWDSDDNFAKVQVLSINGHLMTVKVGYQKISGLRWLPN
jgi:hypothetical protein